MMNTCSVYTHTEAFFSLCTCKHVGRFLPYATSPVTPYGSGCERRRATEGINATHGRFISSHRVVQEGLVCASDVCSCVPALEGKVQEKCASQKWLSTCRAARSAQDQQPPRRQAYVRAVFTRVRQQARPPTCNKKFFCGVTLNTPSICYLKLWKYKVTGFILKRARYWGLN